jgi:hypothetical protein
MGESEDISEDESADKDDKIIDKLIVFTYDISKLNEVEIYFEHKLKEDRSDGKGNKKKKRKAILDKNYKFETFSLPSWLSNTSVFFQRSICKFLHILHEY